MMYRIKEVIPKPADYGIFQAMSDTAENPLPWADSDLTPEQLDTIFYYRYGLRICAPLANSFVVDNITPISTENTIALAETVLNLCGQNWRRLWASYTAEYNPIDNYNMTEHEENTREIEYGHTNTRTDDLTHVTDGEKVFTPRTEVETAGDIYGFNSANPVPTGKSTVLAKSGTDTNTDDTTVTDTGTQTDEESGTDTHTVTRDLTRSGNVGVTTSAQMIRQEIDLWVWNYFDTVFGDICKYLTIPIY